MGFYQILFINAYFIFSGAHKDQTQEWKTLG